MGRMMVRKSCAVVSLTPVAVGRLDTGGLRPTGNRLSGVVAGSGIQLDASRPRPLAAPHPVEVPHRIARAGFLREPEMYWGSQAPKVVARPCRGPIHGAAGTRIAPIPVRSCSNGPNPRQPTYRNQSGHAGLRRARQTPRVRLASVGRAM